MLNDKNRLQARDAGENLETLRKLTSELVEPICDEPEEALQIIRQLESELSVRNLIVMGGAHPPGYPTVK